jgi:hypothetical protein
MSIVSHGLIGLVMAHMGVLWLITKPMLLPRSLSLIPLNLSFPSPYIWNPNGLRIRIANHKPSTFAQPRNLSQALK